VSRCAFMHRPLPVQLLSAVLLIGLAVSGCRRPDQGTAPVKPTYSKQTGRLQQLDYDPDGNGRVNIRTVMDGSRPVRSLIDKNEDGIVERWEYYDESARVVKVGVASRGDGREDTWMFPAPDGRVSRIERSTLQDGKVTRWEDHGAGGILAAREDADGDGRIDRWESYRDGALVLLALDSTRARGRPDRRLIYAVDGSLERLEEDPDGDGVFAPPAGSP